MAGNAGGDMVMGGVDMKPIMEKGQQLAEQARVSGMRVAAKGLNDLQSYIQRGPEGVRLFCFVGGLGLFLCALLGVLHVFGVISQPLTYLVNAYIALFALVTCVLEADPKWVEQNPAIDNAQRVLHDYMKVLTTLWGRGLFYLILGSLATQLYGGFGLFMGMYMILMGVTCIGMHLGYNPDQFCGPVLSKVKGLMGSQGDSGKGDYIRIA